MTFFKTAAANCDDVSLVLSDGGVNGVRNGGQLTSCSSNDACSGDTWCGSLAGPCYIGGDYCRYKPCVKDHASEHSCEGYMPEPPTLPPGSPTYKITSHEGRGCSGEAMM